MDLDRGTFLAASAAALSLPAEAAMARLPPGVRIKPNREEMVVFEGGRIYVRVNGDLSGPRPPLIFAHSGHGSSHWYWLNATALADERGHSL